MFLISWLFRIYIENASHLIIPRIGDEHLIGLKFPNCKTLTAVGWDKNGVIYNMNRNIFPRVLRINYLCGSPGEFRVIMRMSENNRFKWGLPKNYHRFFNDVPFFQRVQLSNFEYKFYRFIGYLNVYNYLWDDYLKDIRKKQFRRV